MGDLGEIAEDDVCVYTVYKDMYIWKKGEIQTFPIAIILVIFFVVLLVVLITWFIKNVKVKNIKSELSELYSASQGGESAKYHNFGEELEYKG